MPPLISNQIIRDENGNPNDSPEAGLHLQLQDFATEALVEHESLHEPIHISANTLCTYIKDAEDQAALTKQRRGVVRPTKPWVRKRRRESTPPEELEPRREERFRED